MTRVNDILSKLAQPALRELPDPVRQTGRALGFKALAQPQALRNTVFLALAFFFVMANYYFVASWTPKLLVDAGLYAVTPGLFDSSVRATATGIVIGVGRFGAILGPGVTGLLLDRGWQATQIYQIIGLPLLLSAAALFILHRRTSRPTAVEKGVQP